MTKQTLFIGFMLFALFFGAGNLIYPPMLGLESGTSFWLAMAGFILTGVGLPIITVAAVALFRNNASELGENVHPLFGVIFIWIIYLAIGPFFGIPRAANVAYEIGVLPMLSARSMTPGTLLFFTVIFFALAFWLSMNPAKLVDRIGQLLTPVLLLAIAVLSVGAFMKIDGPVTGPTGDYQTTPFFTGFIEGYLTMDAIGALAFGIVVVASVRQSGDLPRRELVLATLKAGLVSGAALTLVYGSLGWIGTRMGSAGSFENGGQILTAATQLVFGDIGAILLGIIVALACFTTSVGLIVACAQYFSKSFGASYNMVAGIVTMASLLFANLGLNQIISISVPVLIAIYPIAIVLVMLAFLHQWIQGSVYVYRGVVILTALVSLYEGLAAFGLDLSVFQAIEMLPLFSIGLGWVLPAIIGGSIGALMDYKLLSKQPKSRQA